MSLDDKVGWTLIAAEVVIVFSACLLASYGAGKQAADRWWQADEAKKVQAQRDIDSGENLWQDGRETPALSGGKYSRLPYPVCMEDTGIGYGLVPIPCPKEQR